MKSMIFAAGLGTRLKPLTDTLPKALVPVNGKPLIEHVIKRLRSFGFRDNVVNVHHFADKIESWISEQSWISAEKCDGDTVRVNISDERESLLDTGGAVLHAKPLLEGCGSFLIHNVDILSNADLNWFQSQMKDDSLGILLVSDRETSRFLLFEPGTMRLVGWHNVNTGDYHLSEPGITVDDCLAFGFSGIHILSDKVFGYMEEYVKEKNLHSDPAKGMKFPIMSFYMWAASKVPLYGVLAENLDFLDVGKLDALAPAEEFIKRQ